MPYTRQDLVLAALDNLGATEEGQTPSTETTAKVDRKLYGILAELQDLGICYYRDTDNIPPAAFSALADVVASSCRSIFGITGDEAAGLMQADAMARVTLRTLTAAEPTYLPVRVEHF